jgi:hypothetical protein
MIEDMTVRNLSPATQRSYLAAVSKLSRYFGRSPDCLELEDIRAFQVHLVAIGISWPAVAYSHNHLNLSSFYPSIAADTSRNTSKMTRVSSSQQ